MKSRISNAYVKIFLYMLAGAAVGAVAGAGIYMLLDGRGTGTRRSSCAGLRRAAGSDSADPVCASGAFRAGRGAHLPEAEGGQLSVFRRQTTRNPIGWSMRRKNGEPSP